MQHLTPGCPSSLADLSLPRAAVPSDGPPLSDGEHGVAPSEVGPTLVLISINVTALTLSRLQAVLALAVAEDATFVALQETRHPAGGFPWATRLAESAGYHASWSAPPPPRPAGGRGYGGTALLWRCGYGRSGPLLQDARGESGHRAHGRLFTDLAVVSAYGPAAGADLEWLGHTADYQVR